LLLTAGSSPGADGPVPVGPKRAIAPAAPTLPGAVVASMQERKYDDAIAGFDRLIAAAKEPGDRSYFRFLRGIAETLARKPDAARKTLLEALQADPNGPWAGKIRSELASVELAAGRPAAAEELARAEAMVLLAPERKDRLTEVYHAFARRLLAPDDPVTPPDPVAAYALLSKGRDLAKGPALRASLLFAMARAGQMPEMKKSTRPDVPPVDPIRDFQAYLQEYPLGADRFAARFHLGEAQLAAGQAVAARMTWGDLARDLEKELAKGAAADLARLRARSLLGVARTHGMPNPPDDTQLNLGITAVQRFLAAYPADPDAPRSAYEIGEASRLRGQGDQAIAAFRTFLKKETYRAETPEAQRIAADLAMSATFEIAQILDQQGKYDEAIAGYQAYLGQFPSGPKSAEAQASILNSRLAIAENALRLEKYAEARASWTAFVAANPLDARVPELLYQIGKALALEKRYDEAIAAWDALGARYPGSQPAAHGQYDAASLFEIEKGDPTAAIDRFRKITLEPWKTQATQDIAVMETRALTVVSPRTFRSGETAHLEVTSRNLETLTFSAYKLNPEAYFRKKHLLGEVGSLDIGLVAPDAEWTVPVPGFGKYKPVASKYDLKIALPGVYVVKVSDEKTLQAQALVVGSDLEAIVKVSREQILVFAQDMKTGQGRKGAKVLVADGTGVILEKSTGDDGVLLATWEKPLAGAAGVPPVLPDAGLQYLVFDGLEAAGSGVGVPDKVAQGLSPRAYLSTDRPAYRPGQTVELRGVIRETRDGQYENPAKASYKLEVFDARGRMILARPTTLSDFGTFHQTLRLDSAAPVGSYRIHVERPGVAAFDGNFQVQAYQLEKLALDFDLPKTVYFRGQPVTGHVVAKFSYGAAAAGRPIEVILPDGRTIRGQTDAAGKFPFEFPTEGFAEEQALGIVARLPGDNVGIRGSVMLAVRGFEISLTTPRSVYLDGETFALAVKTTDALGKPAGQALEVAVLKKVTRPGGSMIERQVSKAPLSTDKATGEGRLTLKVDDRDGGDFVVRATGTDAFGNAVFADRPLTISGASDAEKLRILTEQTSFKVGETASVRLHSREKAGPALLAWEADRILQYKIVDLKEGENPLTWDVTAAQFPNFTLTAAKMTETAFDTASLDVRVERDLRLAITPKKPTYAPGEEVELDVSAVDQNGKPAAAEVAIALVDQSLLRLYNDTQPPIGAYFYNQTRTGAFTTEATNTFHDDPTTTPVSEAVVEEAERDLAQKRNDASRGAVLDQAKNGRIEFDLARPGQAVGGGGLGGMPMPAAAPMSAPVATEGTGLFSAGEKLGRIDARDAGGRAGEPNQPWQAGLAFRGPLESRSRRKARALGVDQDDKKLAPREQFSETAYWNPSVVTGADGKAVVKFKAPVALSEYRFTARGVTGSDSLVGQGTATLVVRQNFFVELKQPAVLTQGDKPRFQARVHHTGVKGSVTVSLVIYAGGREETFPRTLDLKGDGIDEILFEPFTVPEVDSLRLSLTAKAADQSDELLAEIPVRPWGIRALASSSGTSSGDATVFVGLPAGRSYEDVTMTIDLAPTLRRLLIELALGRGEFRPFDVGMAPVAPCDTVADRASDLVAAAAALGYLQEIRATSAPEAERLIERIRGLVAELVTAQDDEGGWPWVVATSGRKAPSERLASAQAAYALQQARAVGLLPDTSSLEKASGYLTREFARAGTDFETRATLLHALAALDKATFEQANTLHRVRQGLPDVALAYLALTLAKLDRPSLAGEVLDVLAARARTEAAGVGQKPRKFWEGGNQGPWHRGAVETTAWAALAFARARPSAPETSASAEWLLAHRSGDGWNPAKSRGPALAALAAYFGKAKDAEDRYRLVVTVNDDEVFNSVIQGQAEGKTIGVPRKALKLGASNRVRFHLEGRGTYGYSATMAGFARDFAPEQKRDGKPFLVDDRLYLPSEPELDGKALPTGFGVAINPTLFTNTITQVGQGGRARVRIDASRPTRPGQPSWEREFVVVEETLPAGTTLIDGSLQSGASSFTVVDGLLTLYFGPDRPLGRIEYDVAGYLPGQYRALPTQIRSAYDPGLIHVGKPGDLRVLTLGERSTDPYRATPDELLARGKALFQAGRLPEAAEPLEELAGAYALRDDIARDAARMLLTIHIKDYQPRKIVQDFEILKEKGPELVIPFDEILVVGRAYHDINENERAYLVFRAVAEASYLEDAQVGEVLRQNGRTLDATAYLIDLWRESPGVAAIDGDFFGLSQVLIGAAGRATTNPALRKELGEAGVTRSQLLLQAIRMIQIVLAERPESPMADEASLALVGAYLDLEDYESVVQIAPRYARLFPRSSFLDSFQYSEALGRFQLGQYDRAIEVALRISTATYKNPAGVDEPSPNKWQGLYILGQIYDAQREPAKAVAFYKQVADRFADAAGALNALTRKELKLPEVMIVHPGLPAEPVAVDPSGRNPRAPVRLDYRNLAEADVKVYPVDLMRLYLTRRNLDQVAGIDLAGITPLHESNLKLGDGNDFAEKTRKLDLPIHSKEGAYLVMARGGELYGSGILLVTPLELEVLEDPASSRVRVTVRDAKTGAFVPRVQVKVIGSNNAGFTTGLTDLRGVAVAEGIQGQVTVVARKGAAQYAFYRGLAPLPSVPNAPAGRPVAPGSGEAKPNSSLEENLKNLNTINCERQIDRLQNRINEGRKGIKAEEAK
jgi:uncharacterized protein YfaS (alpha-2-macroglobulin family)/TolA-binding protein